MPQTSTENLGPPNLSPQPAGQGSQPAGAGGKAKRKVYWRIITNTVNPTIEEDENTRVSLHADWTVEIRKKRGRVTETLIIPGSAVKHIYRVEEAPEEEGEKDG